MNELEVKRVPFMGTDLMAAKDESGTKNAQSDRKRSGVLYQPVLEP